MTLDEELNKIIKTFYIAGEGTTIEGLFPDDEDINQAIHDIKVAIIPTEEEILGAVARGWCSKENEHKVMDIDLATAITEEIKQSLGVK